MNELDDDRPREHGEQSDDVVGEIFREAERQRQESRTRPSFEETAGRVTADTRVVAESMYEDWRPDRWKQAEPELHGDWQQHEAGHPEADRPPVDRSRDEPGMWKGDTGDWLAFEENLVTENAHDRVGKAEWPVTDSLGDIANDLEDGRLAGLEYRLKGLERYKEKIAEEVREDTDDSRDMRDISQAIREVPDAMRYTYEFKHDAYTRGYEAVKSQLDEHGYEMVLSKNSWDNAEYKGINTRWRTPEGQLFEVQFHSPDSLAAKQLTHGAYERLRNPLTSDAEVAELKAFQRNVSSFVTVPSGAQGISDYRKEGY